jgi:hypothetical protein
MERAIPKNKGLEFGSLLHQPACEYFANPYSPKLHAFLLEVDPTAKARLPKKPSKTAKPEPVPTPSPAAAAHAKPDAKGKPGDAKTAKPVETKKTDDKKKDAGAKKPVSSPAAASKKPAAPPPKKPAVSTGAKKTTPKSAGKTATLAKRKPR